MKLYAYPFHWDNSWQADWPLLIFRTFSSPSRIEEVSKTVFGFFLIVRLCSAVGPVCFWLPHIKKSLVYIIIIQAEAVSPLFLISSVEKYRIVSVTFTQLLLLDR